MHRILSIFLGVVWWSTISVAEENMVTDIPESASTQHTQQKLMRGELTASDIVEDCKQSNVCKYWTENTAHGYADALLSPPSPLLMANAYGIQHSLLPTIGDKADKADKHAPNKTQTIFLQYTDTTGWLLVVLQNEKMTILYAITATTTKPSENPFVKNRLSSLQEKRYSLLKDCDRIKTIRRDSYGNEFAWQGNGCAQWDAIVEYDPSAEYTLLGLYYPSSPTP